MSSSKHRGRQARPTANIYVDGFNLYYGCLKGTGYKWLDLDALFRTLVPTHEIKRIRYFTARISGRSDKPDSPTRQDAYLRALATLPSVSIHFGKFLQSTVRMPLAVTHPGHAKTVQVIKTEEEKGSDVNLATYLLIDAFRNDCDLAVVVSNDSDLCEPIRIVKDEFGVPVGLLNPHRYASSDLRKLHPTFLKRIRGRPTLGQPVPGAVDKRARVEDQQARHVVAGRQKLGPAQEGGACTHPPKRVGESRTSNNVEVPPSIPMTQISRSGLRRKLLA